MNYTSVQNLIIKAINEKQSLKIRQKETDFDIDFEPYIQGSDFLQKPFVWGYVPFNRVYYKYYFVFIERIALADKSFSVPENLQYYFMDEEEIYASLDEIAFWQNFGPVS